MKTNLLRLNALEYSKEIFVITLFAWISFFPQPLQEKYHLATNIFLIGVFVCLLLRKRIGVFKLNDYPLWVFLIAIGINVFFAQQKNIALKTYLDLAIPMFFIYYLISEDFSFQGRFNLLAKTVCLFSIIVSLIGIFECLFNYNPLYEHFIKNPYYLLKYITGFGQSISTQFDSAPLGGYLLGCLPFNYFLFKRDRSSFRLLGATGIALNTTTLILTFSRCALLGLVLMIVFYLLAQKKYRSIVSVFIILFVFVFIFSYLPYPFAKFGIRWIVGNKASPTYGSDKSDMTQHIMKDHPELELIRYRVFASSGIGDGVLSNFRLQRFNMALRMLKDHPLSGLGFQHFRIRFYEYYPDKHQIPYDIMIADNMYLTLLAETGTIGFLGFFILVFSFLKRGWKQLTILNADSQERWRLLISLMAFVALLVDMGGYEFFYWPNQYLIFCIVIGCINASLKSEVG